MKTETLNPSTVATEKVDAVEIESGREGAQLSRDALKSLAEYTDFMPLGDKTKTYFKGMLDTMLSDPTRIEVNSRNVTNFYSFNALNAVPSDEPTDAKISVSATKIPERIIEMMEFDNWPLDEEQTKKFAYNWLIWHEMGHGVQEAFANSAPRYGSGSYTFAQSLADRTLRDKMGGGSYDSNEAHRSGDKTIESERFAEGFSRMLVGEWLTAEYGAEVAANVLDRMSEYRKTKAKEAAKIYDEFSASGAQEDAFVYFKNSILNESGHSTPNHIGYASPHSPDQIMDIMSQTAVWENSEW